MKAGTRLEFSYEEFSNLFPDFVSSVSTGLCIIPISKDGSSHFITAQDYALVCELMKCVPASWTDSLVVCFLFSESGEVQDFELLFK